jgi:hypothetical protein
MFDIKPFANRLERNLNVFQAVLHGVSNHIAGWKPSANEWSMLEVMNHVAFEEAADFRALLEAALTGAAVPDDDGQRTYTEPSLSAAFERFAALRADSVTWLRTLEHSDWNATIITPDGRTLSARALLGSWLAHDWLHIRQLSRLHFQRTVLETAPDSVAYAGDWFPER